MRGRLWLTLKLSLACFAGGQMLAQSQMPMLVQYGGFLRDVAVQPAAGAIGVTFLLYQDQQGGAPMWMETQNVTPDRTGRYTVLLGAMSAEGLPGYLFAEGDARWLAVQVAGQVEQARVPLAAVPYAIKAKDADTLGGLPASAFAPATPAAAQPAANSEAGDLKARDASPSTSCSSIISDGTATPNQVTKFTAACAVEPSAIFESGGKVGIGTTTPAATLDVKGTATLRGALTMNPKSVATASAGADSNSLDLIGASFNSSTAASISQHFRWQAEAAGNDSATPSGTLNLLYASGSGTPAETGLALSSKGLVTFAPGQTFPGAGTITGVTAGTGLTGGGTAGNVSVGLTTACANGQVLEWNGTAWACAAVNAGTITGVTAGAGLSGGGTSGNITLTSTGVLSVTGGTGITSSGGNAPTVSLNTGFTDGRYVQLAGGALGGPLNLPANGLAVAGNQLVLANGSVGVGTAAPGAPLEVAGNLKISGTGSALTFPDGSTQTTAAAAAGPAALNPLQLALLKWFPAYQSATFTTDFWPRAVAFDGANIWVANDDSVDELRASTGALVGQFNPPALGLAGIVFDGENLWVTGENSNNVSKLSASNGTTLGTYSVGNTPYGIAFDGTNIWVANLGSNSVTKLLASTGAVVGTYNVGAEPQAIAFDGANIWVTNVGDGTVTELSAATGAVVGTYNVGSAPEGIAFDGTNIWVVNYYGNSVTKLLAANGTVIGTYSVGVNPGGVAFDGTYVWVTSWGSNIVTKLVASTGALAGAINVGYVTVGIGFDGANMWITSPQNSLAMKL